MFTMFLFCYFCYMDQQISSLQQSFENDLQAVSSETALLELERVYLGRSGKIADLFTQFAQLPGDQKKIWGQKLNDIKNQWSAAINQKRGDCVVSESDTIDISVQKKLPSIACLHPLTQVIEDIERIFVSMGFSVWDGPEADTDYNNFQALNVPEHHPARDMQDTFYLEKEPYVLRTHTSNMQNRILKSKTPPIRAIVPGRVFRYEATDASHDMTFYQLEGIMVDKHVSIAHLKYVLDSFLQALFNKEVQTRIRPGYFPFVEPGLEMEMVCEVCEGKGCPVCKQNGWVEVMPCGMIHPNVLKEGGIDPQQYSGFAFGFGVTRLVMMKYKIDDIRHLHSGDLRFLQQFTE